MNSYAMVTESSLERNGKRNDEGSSECVVGFLRSRLALSSRKLLLQDPCKEDSDKGNKNRVKSGWFAYLVTPCSCFLTPFLSLSG